MNTAATAYAVVVGEALVDLIEDERDGQTVYRPLVGGAPLNVATGLRRLGTAVEFVGSVGVDPLGDRIWALLHDLGVGTRCSARTQVNTTLAVTSLRAGEPEFTFYGDPPSFAQIGPADPALVARAAAVYCGSIALMYDGSRAAAEAAWRVPGPLKVLDPNVRPRLLKDRDHLRAVIEGLAATADLVKLSAPDALALFDQQPSDAARHLRELGARAVMVTLGSQGALLRVTDAAGTDRTVSVSAPVVRAVDTTGAGDACMAALIHGLVASGVPGDVDGWRELAAFAVTAAALSCQVPGGATAMPTLEAIHQARR